MHYSGLLSDPITWKFDDGGFGDGILQALLTVLFGPLDCHSIVYGYVVDAW